MAEATDDNIMDKREVLSPKAVKGYAERFVERGEVEYNNGSILVKSKHPLDQCAKRGIIEDHHYDIGKAIITIRECAFSKLKGRPYNSRDEGDSGIDAATLYTNTWRRMTPKQWRLIELICFAEPKPDGEYFSEVDYQMIFRIAPNIQAAFEALDKAFMEARDAIKIRIEQSEKIKAP